MKYFLKSIAETLKDKRTYIFMGIYAAPAIYRITTGDSTIPYHPYPDLDEVPLLLDNLYEKLWTKPFFPGGVGVIWAEKYKLIKGKTAGYTDKLLGAMTAFGAFTSLQVTGDNFFDPQLPHGGNTWEQPHHYPVNFLLTLLSPLVVWGKREAKKSNL